jgi:serine/threonine-protein kinase HipA
MTALPTGRLQVRLDFGAGAAPIVLGECLWYGKEKVVAFEWSEHALALRYQLSPFRLPIKKGVFLAQREPFEGLHGMLSDSIPDGFGRRIMNNSFKEAGYSLETVTPIHRLAWVGTRGIGALTYAPVIGPAETKDLIDIANLGLYAKKADVDNFSEIPISVLRAGGSALGARPKFWASVHKDGEMVIVGDNPASLKDFTPCLVKFAPVNGDKNEPYFEAACLQLANSHGIRAAKARLLSHPGGAALAVERFDRSPGRVFVQSLAALLEDDFRFPRLDYGHIYQVSKNLSVIAEAERIYRQACFNVALSMKDDHSKNFAFIMGPDGRWELSPAFDLCPNEGPSGWQTMSVSNESQHIGRDELVKFAKTMGLADSVAKDGIDQALAAANEFAPLAIDLGAQKSATKKWEKAFKEIENRLAATMVPVNTSTPARKGSSKTAKGFKR